MPCVTENLYLHEAGVYQMDKTTFGWEQPFSL